MRIYRWLPIRTKVPILHSNRISCNLLVSGGVELRPSSPLMRRADSPSLAAGGSTRDAELQHLLAFPLESNFSGERYDPGLGTALPRRQISGETAGRRNSGEALGGAARRDADAGPRRRRAQASASAGGARELQAEFCGGRLEEADEGGGEGIGGCLSPEPGAAAASSSGLARGHGAGGGGAPPHGEWQNSGETLPHGEWRVLLDAAKACGSSPPDLAAFPADFVVGCGSRWV
jgi:hypothetical protein